MSSGAEGKLGNLQRSLAEQARDFIRDKITSGEYPPGERIKERDLSEQLGISRIPIREAFAGLATEGFLTIVPRRGAIVTQLVPEDLVEIFELREALEVQEIRLALRHGTAEDKAALLEIVEAERAALESGDAEEVQRRNGQFHAALIEMSHNALLTQMLEPLRGRLSWLLKQNDDATAICHEHYAIAQAIAAEDDDQAIQLAAAHVATSKRLANELLFGADQP